MGILLCLASSSPVIDPVRRHLTTMPTFRWETSFTVLFIGYGLRDGIEFLLVVDIGGIWRSIILSCRGALSNITRSYEKEDAVVLISQDFSHVP